MKSRFALLAFSFVAGFLCAAEDERPVVDASKVAVEKIANAALPTFHIVGDSTVKSGGTDGKFGAGVSASRHFLTRTKSMSSTTPSAGAARGHFLPKAAGKKWRKQSSPATLSSSSLVTTIRGASAIRRTNIAPTAAGIGDETVEDTRADGTKEAVHTFGWYMAKFVTDARAHGRDGVIRSPIPHKQHWETGRDFESIALWDSQVAKNNGALFFDLTHGHHRGL